MSFLVLLNPDELATILPYLEKYEKMIDGAAPIFELENRKLEEIMRTLPYHQVKFEQALQETKALDEWINVAKEKRTARAWKKFIEGYPRALATRDVQAYIGGEKEIIEVNQIAIEVSILKNKLASIVEALKQMAWMVGNITKLRVAELQETVL